jgi:hypothetical protein
MAGKCSTFVDAVVAAEKEMSQEVWVGGMVGCMGG